MSNHAQAKNMTETKYSNDNLVGEIIDQRFALLEGKGPSRTGYRYLAYDMQGLKQTDIIVFPGADHWYMVLDPSTPPPIPPPIPPAEPRPAPPGSVRRRIETKRFEAAWFVTGEHLADQEEQEDLQDAVPTQADVENVAHQLDQETIHRYAL